MSEKQFDFGVDIPTKVTKYTKRFTDLEGFLDEDYDGEHHMLWDNQEECWICLDDVLCLIEKEYVNIKGENELLRKRIQNYEQLIANSYVGEEETLDGWVGKYVIFEDELQKYKNGVRRNE